MKKETSEQGNACPAFNLDKILATQKQINEISKKVIKFTQPILSQDGRPFIFPNSITTIQGQTGCHKSRIAEHIVSSFISKPTETKILGLQPLTSNKFTIVYVDTERNIKDQFPRALQRMKLLAGYSIDEDIPNLQAISLIDYDRAKRFTILKEYLEFIRSTSKVPIVVVIDVITDCVINFNDPIESLRLTDFINQMINDYKTTFICLIHENPSMSENKARGHLGTELSNKSTTILKIGFASNSNNLIELKMLKTRLTKKYPPIYLRLNSDTEILEIADSLEIQSLNQNKANFEDIVPFLIKELLTNPIDRKALIAKVAIKFNCSQETAIHRITSLYDNKAFNRYGYELIYENVPGKRKNMKQYRIEKNAHAEEPST